MIAAVALTLAAQTLPPIRNLQPVPFTDVRIEDRFWAPKREINRKVSIPHTMDECEATPRIKNFELAAQRAKTGHQGYVFDDSDVYKCLEAAAYALQEKRDAALEKRVDGWIAKIGAAQMPDGYLDTAYIIGRPEQRFTRLYADHELYCAGHLFEAAVAHYQATGKRTLLDIATKYADLLCRTFGTGKRMGYPGHPECELALVKLWRATGKQEYFELAKFFVESRGSHYFAKEQNIPDAKYDGTYWLDDVPIAEHREIKGHAVRAAYLFAGVADVTAQTRNEKLQAMLDRVWMNTVSKRVFITGGIGPSGSNEGFTVDYDLPNESAYQETCASAAMIFWNHRMGLLEGNAKYWDWVERALYNGFLSGVSCKGDAFYYVNPLASSGGHHREPWFACACCPPNVTRTLASLGQYVYAKTGDSLYVNLYIQGGVKTKVGPDMAAFNVTTNFPWDGKVTIKPAFSCKGGMNLYLRVPGWCRDYALTLNGKKLDSPVQDGYLKLRNQWTPSDTVVLNMAMPVEKVAAHPQVKEDTGKIALMRGPIVYCLEQIDQSQDQRLTSIPLTADFGPAYNPNELGGIGTLTGQGVFAQRQKWTGNLYQPLQTESTPIVAIPYYAWDNRGSTRMDIWMPTQPVVPMPQGIEAEAKVKLSFVSSLCTPTAVNDGREIAGSNKHPGALCHFWPHKGGEEWIEYSWTKPQVVSGSQVYWFDDTGVGECRPPSAWHIEFLEGGQWKPVKASGYPVALDQWCTASFEPVTTSALRLVLKQQDRWSVGVHEWRVLQPEG